MTTTTTDNTKQLSAIERALAAAKARKAAKEASGDADSAPPTIAATPKTRGITATSTIVAQEKKEAAAQRRAAASNELERMREERRAAREAKKTETAARLATERTNRNADRDARRAQRAEKRAAREAELQARRGSAHMKKVERARAKLPAMATLAANIFADATSNLTAAQLEALSLHLQFHNRLTATKASPAKALPIGTEVTITAGDHRFVGMKGTVTRSQKLRSYVSIPNVPREIYIFTSYLQPTT